MSSKPKVWFVVQKRRIKALSAEVIGFWNQATNYDPISIGDKIIYYSGGKELNDGRKAGNIEGIFKVIDKRRNIDININNVTVIDPVTKNRQNLIWQFKIQLKKQKIINKKYLDDYQKNHRKGLLFYNNWSTNQWGGGNVQIFPSCEKDIEKLKKILRAHWNQSTKCLP